MGQVIAIIVGTVVALVCIVVSGYGFVHMVIAGIRSLSPTAGITKANRENRMATPDEWKYFNHECDETLKGFIIAVIPLGVLTILVPIIGMFFVR